MTKTWPLSQVRVAAGQAIAEGKSIVRCDSGVMVLTYHPFSRLAPNVEGDGGDVLASEDERSPFDLSDTRPSCGRSFNCDDANCVSCRSHGCHRCGRSLGEHDDIEINDTPCL